MGLSPFSIAVARGRRASRAGLRTAAGVLALVAAAAAAPSWSSEVITYTYDALGRVRAVQSSGTVNNNRTGSYCYDPAGNRTVAKADANGATATCTPTPSPTPSPSLQIDDSLGFEGQELEFMVTLSAASSSTVSVNYATAYGSAGSADFTATSGTLTFSPGQTARYIYVMTALDQEYEDVETFTVNLSGPSGATISRGEALGAIHDQGGQCGEFLCFRETP